MPSSGVERQRPRVGASSTLRPINGHRRGAGSRRGAAAGRARPAPSLTPPVEPGRLTISVRPAVPASPRESTEVGTVVRAVPADRLGDAGRLPVQHGARRLGRDVGGGQAGAAGGEDDVDARRPPRRAAPPRARDVVRQHVRALDGEAELAQALGEHLAAGVLVDAGGGPVGRGDDDGPGAGRQLAVIGSSPRSCRPTCAAAGRR